MVTLLFIQFARYPYFYVLGAFPAWLKVLSHNFGAVLSKKPKSVHDSVPLSIQFPTGMTRLKNKFDYFF